MLSEVGLLDEGILLPDRVCFPNSAHSLEDSTWAPLARKGFHGKTEKTVTRISQSGLEMVRQVREVAALDPTFSWYETTISQYQYHAKVEVKSLSHVQHFATHGL